ncbi:hypothetical protein PGB90_008926 [Kerria lacca]
MRDFNHETKLVIRHLQKALLDIIDLNLSQQELKNCIFEYLSELLNIGPAYIEVQEKIQLHDSNPSLQIRPPHSRERFDNTLNLQYPFTGQDPRNIHSHSNQKAQIPQMSFRTETAAAMQSDIASADHECENEPNLVPFPEDFSNIYIEETYPIKNATIGDKQRKGSRIRKNLFPDIANLCEQQREVCYHENFSSHYNSVAPEYTSQDTNQNERKSFADYLEEFENYIRHKYLCPSVAQEVEQIKIQCKNGLQVKSKNKLPDDTYAYDNDPNLMHCSMSKFEKFFRESEAGTSLEPEEMPESERETQNDNECQMSRFESFLQNTSTNEETKANSADSTDEEEFIRQMLHIDWPKRKN